MVSFAVSIFACCFAMGGWFAPAAPRHHLLVTDEDGRPLAQARVCVKWKLYQQTPYKLEPRSVVCTTDADGRCQVEIEDDRQRDFKVASVEYPGYRFDSYLNPDLYLPTKALRQTAPERPFRLVMRKALPEVGITVSLPLNVRFCAATPQAPETVKPVDVNIFADLEKDCRMSEKDRTVDFTVTPRFHADHNTWSFILSTTNAGCGLIATPRCVYRAPETGYAPRIEVGADEYTNRAFAVYLRTRPQGFVALLQPVTNSGYEHWRHVPFDFTLATALVDLTGTGLFERPQVVDPGTEMRLQTALRSALIDYYWRGVAIKLPMSVPEKK